MTSLYEDLDTEAAEYADGEEYEAFGESEDDLEFEPEAYDDSEDEESRRRRARARRIAAARRRQAELRGRARARSTASRGRPVPARRSPTPAARSASAAIRAVDLESKVADDSLRQELNTQRKRMSRSEYAAVAGLAVNQFIESFDQPENTYAKAALRFAPLLLLSPQQRGSGVQRFATDPRVIGGAAVFGIAFLGERRNAAGLDVAGAGTLAQGAKTTFAAQVLSPRGEVLAGRDVIWESSDPTIATVDPRTGEITANSTKKGGAVFITARAPGLPAQRKQLVVTA